MARPAPRRSAPRWSVLLATLAALSALSALGPIGAPHAAHPPSLGVPRTPAVAAAAAPVGGGRVHPPALAAARPASGSNEFYTQIGSTLSELNGTAAVTEVPVLSEEVTLVSSPYPTAYELNLLSSTGDWYQVAISDNWPGCSSGFEELTEIWNNSDGGQPVVCTPTVALSQGNVVELNGSIAGYDEYCLGVKDLNTSRSDTFCGTQPDIGANEFDLLSQTANFNGYYTGTMTEVVNTSATSCPDYTLLPTVTFGFPAWVDATQYIAWSDEWNNVRGGVYCGQYNSGITSLGNDPRSVYIDATGGRTYGPLYVEGQNDTRLNSSVGFRFQTDPDPLQSVDLAASTMVAAEYSTVEFDVTISGGVAPYTVLWQSQGTWVGPTVALDENFSVGPPGNYSVFALGIDAQGDALASAVVDVEVPYPLSTGPLGIRPGPGVDVGETANLSVTVHGGVPPLSFSWTGLPYGCASVDTPYVLCTPTGAENTTVSLTIVQGNGSTDRPPSFDLKVSPKLSLELSTPRSVADVGQSEAFEAIASGGAGGDTYSWSDLPTGCVPTGDSVDCTLTTPASYLVGASVVDANQAESRATTLDFTVATDLNASISASAPRVDVGSGIVLAAQVTGGAGGDHFGWTGLPTGCAPVDAATLVCRPSSTGNASIGLTVTDAANGTYSAPPLPIDVYPALSVALTANRTSAPAPGSFRITPVVTGGAPVRNVTWLGLPPGCSAGGISPASCTGLAEGSYLFEVEVRDSGNGSAAASIRLNVTGPAPPPSGGSGTFPAETVALIAVVAIAGAAIALLLGRSSASGPGSGPETTVPDADGWDLPPDDTDAEL